MVTADFCRRKKKSNIVQPSVFPPQISFPTTWWRRISAQNFLNQICHQKSTYVGAPHAKLVLQLKGSPSPSYTVACKLCAWHTPTHHTYQYMETFKDYSNVTLLKRISYSEPTPSSAFCPKCFEEYCTWLRTQLALPSSWRFLWARALHSLLHQSSAQLYIVA